MTSSSNPGLSRVVTDAGRTERKHTQIVDSARTLFLESGFDTTSVDAIARHAGVSKATLYAHFTDKDALLLALVEEDCERRRDPLWMPHDRTIDLERDLREIGQRFLSIFLDDQALAMHRLIMSCAARYPAIAEAFMRAGPDRCDAEVAAFLRAAKAEGLIDVPNVRLAATQFLMLMQAPSAAESRAQLEGGIKVFIAAYGRKAGPTRQARPVTKTASKRARAPASRRP